MDLPGQGVLCFRDLMRSPSLFPARRNSDRLALRNRFPSLK